MALEPNVAVDFINGVSDAFRAGDPAIDVKSAETDNVAALMRQFQCVADNDWAGFADLLDEDAGLEIVGPPSVPFRGRWKGRRETAATVQRNFGLLEGQKPELISIIAQGDMVVVHARETGRVKATGAEYAFEFVQFHTFRAGRSVACRQLVVEIVPDAG